MPTLTNEPPRAHPRTLDLRGAGKLPATLAVLEDQTGRRRARMRRIGRATALLFALWLAVLVLGGLGLIPVRGIPLAGALKPPTQPPPLDHRIVRPQPGATARERALRRVEPARHLAPSRGSDARRERSRRAPVSRPGTPPRGGGQTLRPGSTPAAGPRGASAPGRLGTAPGGGTSNRPMEPGRSTAAPSHTGVAPGKPVATPDPAVNGHALAAPVGAGPPAER